MSLDPVTAVPCPKCGNADDAWKLRRYGNSSILGVSCAVCGYEIGEFYDRRDTPRKPEGDA